MILQLVFLLLTLSQNFEFHFNPGLPRNISSQSQWLILQNQNLIAAPRLPSFGETVYFDLGGTYTVFLFNTFNCANAYVGSNNTFVTLQLQQNSILNVTGTLQIERGSGISTSDSTLASPNVLVYGTIRQSSRSKLIGHIKIFVNGTLIQDFGDVEIGSITCYGKFQPYGTTTFFGTSEFINSSIVGQGTLNFTQDLILFNSNVSKITNFYSNNIIIESSTNENSQIDSFNTQIYGNLNLKKGNLLLTGMTSVYGDTIGKNSFIILQHTLKVFSNFATNIIANKDNLFFINVYFNSTYKNINIEADFFNLPIVRFEDGTFTINGNWNVLEFSITRDSIVTLFFGNINLVSSSNIFTQRLEFIGDFAKVSNLSLFSDSVVFNVKGELILENVPFNSRSYLHIRGRVTGLGTTLLVNNFNFVLDSSLYNVHMNYVIQNTGTFGGTIIFRGEKMIYVTGNIKTEYETFIVFRGNVTIESMNLEKGNISLSGNIYSKNFTLGAQYGVIDIKDSYTHHGHLTFMDQSLLVINLRGKGDFGAEKLILNGTATMKNFIFLKMTIDYVPSVGDQTKFLTQFNIVPQMNDINPTIGLYGIPLTSAYINSKGNLEVINSVANFDRDGYFCHYLGNARTIETFDLSQTRGGLSWAVTFTTPYIGGWMGFGINTEDQISYPRIKYENVSKSYSVISSSNQTFTVLNHTFIEPTSKIMDFSSGKSFSMFGVSDKMYRSITLIFSKAILSYQSKLIFVGNPKAEWNGSMKGFPGHTYKETFDFDLTSFYLDNYVPCTNFIQPQRAEVRSIAGIVIMFIIYLIIFIFWVLLIRFQPLNSRGISPFLTLFFLFAQLGWN